MVSPDVDAVNKAMFQHEGRNLTGGVDKCPVIDFIAWGHDWDVKPSPYRQGETFIVFTFNQLQVLSVRPESGAYPSDVLELSIKHSRSARSAFGFVTASINKAVGVGPEDSDLDHFKGRMWHVTMSTFKYGVKDGQEMIGEVWTFVLQASVGGTAVATPATPSPIVNSPATAVSPATEQPAAVQATAVSTTTPGLGTGATKTSEEQAKDMALSLLHGQTQAQFLPKIVTNETVRLDNDLFLSIINQTWIAGLVKDGHVVVNPDGTHSVVSIAQAA